MSFAIEITNEYLLMTGGLGYVGSHTAVECLISRTFRCVI